MNSLDEYIITEISPLKHLDTIAVAQDFFLENNYSHFPVTENEVYIGCLSREDSEIFLHDSEIGSHRYDFERFYVRTALNWLDVLEEFAKNETNIMPVLNDNNQYIGFYEIEEALKLFNAAPFFKDEGGILVIKKNNANFSMSQIAQIVESNNAKLLGMFISETDANFCEVTLKVSQSGLNDIIQTFRRFDYNIISQHQEDSYIENLKERSDYLDKYLNI